MATNASFVNTLGGTSSLMVEAVADIFTGLSSVVTATALTIYTWQKRAEQRRHLAGLDKRLLSDMGISFDQVDREVEKPFWVK